MLIKTFFGREWECVQLFFRGFDQGSSLVKIIGGTVRTCGHNIPVSNVVGSEPNDRSFEGQHSCLLMRHYYFSNNVQNRNATKASIFSLTSSSSLPVASSALASTNAQ